MPQESHPACGIRTHPLIQQRLDPLHVVRTCGLPYVSHLLSCVVFRFDSPVLLVSSLAAGYDDEFYVEYLAYMQG